MIKNNSELFINYISKFDQENKTKILIEVAKFIGEDKLKEVLEICKKNINDENKTEQIIFHLSKVRSN